MQPSISLTAVESLAKQLNVAFGKNSLLDAENVWLQIATIS